MLPRPDYQFLTQFVADRGGQRFGSDKQFLMQARLVPLAQSWGLASLRELVDELRKAADSPLGAAVVDLLMRSDTQFFRDPALFDDLEQHFLPRLIKARRATRRLRLWSAGTATGQEAWSLAMLLKHGFPELEAWSLEIVGTDRSAMMIDRAKRGCYSQTEVQLGLPIRHLLRWFEPSDGAWRVNEELRRVVRFEVEDLAGPAAEPGLFDVIVCSHTLQDLLPSERRIVLERLSQSVAPDGYLLLSSDESLGTTPWWDRVDGYRSVAYSPSSQAVGRWRITG